MTMIWNNLLSNQRFRTRSKKDNSDARNDFEDDISRIIFSSAFRRLQDKTQVFPLERDSLVRTRLTHSMEVSNIARSIGLSIEKILVKNKEITEEHLGKIPSIVAAAGLVHDLGNPPFGHYGEDAFKHFYSDKTEKLKAHKLTDEQIEDLVTFDGNVQTFRHLTKLQFLKDEFSYNLSFPTLATIIKYPCSSKEGNKKSGDVLNISLKKFGYFQSEIDKFQEIWKSLGIPDKVRHPLTFILEAADDIAYSVNDLEDGVRKNIINSNTFLEKIECFIKKNHVREDDQIVDVYKNCTYIKSQNSSRIENCIIEQFRIEAHSRMIKSAVEAFTDKTIYDQIMNGSFISELLKKSNAANIRKFFSSFAGEDVFSDKDVLKLELMGEEVICGLLDKFFIISDSDTKDLEKTKSKAGKIFHLISDNYRHIYKKYTNNDTIDRIQLINDHICGMTDSYALQTYRKLMGIEL